MTVITDQSPVIIKPVAKLTLWQRFVAWLKRQLNRIIWIAAFVIQAKFFYEWGQWSQLF